MQCFCDCSLICISDYASRLEVTILSLFLCPTLRGLKCAYSVVFLILTLDCLQFTSNFFHQSSVLCCSAIFGAMCERILSRIFGLHLSGSVRLLLASSIGFASRSGARAFLFPKCVRIENKIRTWLKEAFLFETNRNQANMRPPTGSYLPYRFHYNLDLFGELIALSRAQSLLHPSGANLITKLLSADHH